MEKNDKKKAKTNFQGPNGLIPVVVQEEKTMDILMLGYMDKNAFEKTINSGFVYFWSRKRKKLWMKGETSGNKLKVKSILMDCDNDALLVQVRIVGKACCHTGKRSCFYQRLFYKFTLEEPKSLL